MVFNKFIKIVPIAGCLGWGLSTVTGVFLGERIFRSKALKAIKESRKPRVVE